MHLPWRNVAPGPGPAISTSITAAESARLADLAKGLDVLEIGSAYGYSAVVMARAGAWVTAVDPHEVHASWGVMAANLGVFGVAEQVRVLRGTSDVELPALYREGYRFGLVFVDGDHTETAVARDVEWARGLLVDGGVLACHDYGEDCCCPGVRAALDRAFPAGPDEFVDTLFVVAP